LNYVREPAIARAFGTFSAFPQLSPAQASDPSLPEAY